MKTLTIGETYLVSPGDHFKLVLPDGMVLTVEQTADDFSIVKSDDIVAYTRATSPYAKSVDRRWAVTGRN